MRSLETRRPILIGLQLALALLLLARSHSSVGAANEAAGRLAQARSSQMSAWSERNATALEARLHQQQADNELVAVGATSLAPNSPGQLAGAGRLVDRIASTNNQHPQNMEKLDYIIEFMRQNKLSKFCDLLTSPEASAIVSQLNGMAQFTLFVPTNEALLLLPPGHHFELLKARPREAASFLLGHVTSELVVPASNALRSPNNQSASQSTSWLALSLAGAPLRISSVAAGPAQPDETAPPAGSGANLDQHQMSLMMSANKLELIVNGANVLPGHSYALQEPNKLNATHAIVHLIDRSLWPAASSSLQQLVRQVSPTMSQLFELANDPALHERLESSGATPTTVLAPDEEAFRATAPKLLDQLHTNRTFLINFLRAHLISHGVHFNGELAARAPLSLESLAPGNEPLRFETKRLQGRQLVLVNAVPIISPDLMASNGLVHIVSRPLFAANLLEDCQCGNVMNAKHDNRSMSEKHQPRAESGIMMRGRGSHEREAVAGDALEREASSSLPERLRAGRSRGSLPIGRERNSDYYRPSHSPANLQLAGAESSANAASTEGRSLGGPASGSVIWLQDNSPNKPALSQDPAMTKYEVTLNASSRLRMRAEQSQRQASATTNSPPQQHTLQFAYDQPLVVTPPSGPSSAGTSSGNNRRPYLAGVIEAAASNQKSSIPVAQSDASNGSIVIGNKQREQRLLRFQPEDGRDAPGAHASSKLSTNSSANMMPAYDLSSEQQNQAPKSGGAGSPLACAFYDSECRRLMGRLVRLPPSLKRPHSKALVQQNTTTHSSGTTAAYDSTFGESSLSPIINSTAPVIMARPPASQNPAISANHNHAYSLTMGSQRLSALNQPLPPLSHEETQLRQLHASQSAANLHWRSQDSDLTRIPQAQIQTPSQSTQINNIKQQQTTTNGHGFTSGLARQLASNSSVTFELPRASPDAAPRQAQILLVPVKLITTQDKQMQSNNSNYTKQQHLNSNSFGGRNFSVGAIEVPSLNVDLRPTGDILLIPTSSVAPPSSQQIQTTTPFSAGHSSGRLLQSQSQLPAYSPIQHYILPGPVRSNLTLSDDPTMEGFDSPAGLSPGGGGGGSRWSSAHYDDGSFNASAGAKLARLRVTNSQPIISPSLLHRKQQHHNQLVATHPGAKSQPGTVHFGQPASLVHQTAGKWPQQQQLGGDFSVTSARLTTSSPPASMYLNASGLATQASDPQLASVRQQQQQQQLIQNGADYFQDRTIAEIMDDSGLRIDGQLVTFKRLKQCLADANLLQLASQTSNSMSIFMPTDQAFQRLVQTAFGKRQQEESSSSSFNLNSNSLPLVVRAPPSDERELLSGGLDSSPILSSLNQIDRLTLDCQAPSVRQMLLDHISSKLITPRQLIADSAIPSLSGRQLILSSVPSKQIVVIDGQPVLAATRAKNGMVYVINKFLNISQQMPNVIELMQTQPDLSTFMSYMRLNNQIQDRLKRDSGPLTILAPTNDAFDQLSPAARQLINSDPTALMDILRGHVLDGAQFGKLISMRAQLVTMNQDQRIEAKVIKPNVYMLDNQMTSMRLVGTAANGVVNAIDRLIVPNWLRNGMSVSSSSSSPNGNSNSKLFGINPASGSGLDTSATAARQIARLNLPALRDKPLRFEQPELVHGSADTIFRSGASNSRFNSGGDLMNNNHRSNTGENNLNIFNRNNNFPPFEDVTTSNNNNFNTNSTPSSSIFSSPSPTSTPTLSSSSSSSLAGSQDSESFTPSFPMSNNNNHNNNTININNSSQSTITSKNMQLIEKLANLMRAKLFLKLLLKSRAHEFLKPDMNYVILVPTDQAVERLPPQIISLLERDADKLADLINYHILDTTFDYINTIPDGQTLQTLNEKDILFNWHRNNTALTVSGALVLGGIQEENIALIMVDRVLYPTPGDLLGIVTKSPILSNFTSIVRNAGLDIQLTRAGPFTLFAPSDVAFSQLDKSDLEFLKRNKEIARRFLLRHLSSPMIFTSSIALSGNNTTSPSSSTRHQFNPIPTMNITNSLGEDLILRQRSEYFSVNDINFSYADVAATNGVLHVIDGLL